MKEKRFNRIEKMLKREDVKVGGVGPLDGNHTEISQIKGVLEDNAKNGRDMLIRINYHPIEGNYTFFVYNKEQIK
jgi:hypothetical protein